MSKFDKALAVMSVAIFPNFGDHASCSRQAKKLWERAKTLPFPSQEEYITSELGHYWNRQAIAILDDFLRENEEWDRIFGPFIQESFRQQRLKKYPSMSK